jgi:hypothetical protein
MAEPLGINSPTGQMGCFHPSYLTVIHCHCLSVCAAVVLTLIIAIDLAENTLADWSHNERFLFALFYLF